MSGRMRYIVFVGMALAGGAWYIYFNNNLPLRLIGMAFLVIGITLFLQGRKK